MLRQTISELQSGAMTPADDLITAMVTQMTHPAGYVAQSGAFAACNSELAHCLGMTVSDLRNRTLLDLLAADTPAEVRHRLGQMDQMPPVIEARLAGPRTELNVSMKPLGPLIGAPGYLCQKVAQPVHADPRIPFFMENLDQGVWESFPQEDRLVVSQSFRDMRGLRTGDPVQDPDRDWMLDVHPEDRDLLRRALCDMHNGQCETINLQYRRLHSDGHWIWILCRGRTIEKCPDGRPLRIVGTDTDITEIKQTEDEFTQQKSKLQLALDAASIGIWEFDPVAKTVHWDNRMLDIYGVTDGQNTRPGDSWQGFLHPEDRLETVAYSEKCASFGEDFSHDYRIVRQDKTVRHVRSMARLVETDQGKSKLIGVNIDVTEDYRHAAELEEARRELHHEARHDALTGLANRRLLDEKIAGLYARMAPDDSYAVLQLDLDHFKRINDTYGHAAGDAVLVAAADRLKRLVPDDALIARSGGDEFVVLFPSPAPLTQLETTARTIVEAMQIPVQYDGISCDVGVSVGLAQGVGPPHSKSEIFINADLALYEAKKAGRSCFRTFSDTYRIKSDLRLR